MILSGLGDRRLISDRCDELRDLPPYVGIRPSAMSLQIAQNAAENLSIVPDLEGGCTVTIATGDREAVIHIDALGDLA